MRKLMPKTKAAPRDICLLGYAEETRDLVFDLPADVEVWGINMAHAFTFKVKEGKWVPVERLKAKTTEWFQLHPRNWSSLGNAPTGFFGRPKEHVDFLKGFAGNVWLQSEEIGKELEIPNAKPFPLADIAAKTGRTYFTSSFAYQLGMAWYQHVVEGRPIRNLYAYGINLTSLDEYTHQKPCVEYWFGRLEQAGVKVIVPSGSALLKGKVYAMAEDDLSDHAFSRLQHWKQNYWRHRDDHLVGTTLKVDTDFWTRKFSEFVQLLNDKFPDIKLLEHTELRDVVQGWINKRVSLSMGMVDRAAGEALKSSGMVTDNQHWLTITGGIDYRATALPEMISANPKLAEDIDVPVPQAI